MVKSMQLYTRDDVRIDHTRIPHVKPWKRSGRGASQAHPLNQAFQSIINKQSGITALLIKASRHY